MAAAYKYTQLAKDASTPALRSEYERISNWLTELLVFKQEELNRKALEVKKLQTVTSVSIGQVTTADDNFIRNQLATDMARLLITEDLLVIEQTADAVTNSIRYRATLFAAKSKDPEVHI